MSVYDADKVTPGDITASGLKGEVKSITPELVQKHGLILEKTPGADNLPPLLRDNHWEISKPEAMSRKAFKDALKALSKELEGGE